MKYGLNIIINNRLFVHSKWGNLVVKKSRSPSLRSKDQTSQMTFVVVNNEILIKYSLLPRLGAYLNRLNGLLNHLNNVLNLI
jgi:hypothetical protein